MPLNQLESFINNLSAFDFGEELEIIVEANKEAIVNLQAEQMAQGRDVNGQQITLDGGGYAPSTIEQKKRYGQGLGAVTDRVTRYQTGELYRQLFAEVTGGIITISSNVQYWDTLIQRTTDVGVGLDEDQRRTFAEEITLPNIKTVLKEKTGLTIS